MWFRSDRLAHLIAMSAVVVSLHLPLGGIASAAQTEITYFLGGGRDDIFAQVATNFEGENPDIRVEGMFSAELKLGGAQDAILALTAAGTPPDVIIMTLGQYAPLGKVGVLEDINSYLRADASYRALRQGLFINILDRFVMPDGRLFALPVDINFRMLFYNRDHLDQAGMAYPKDAWSFGEFAQAARRLTQIESDGTARQWGFSGFSGPPSAWITWVHGNGGQVVDRFVDPTQSTFSLPATCQAVQMLVDLIHEERGAAPLGASSGFGGQKSSMSLDWVEQVHNYEKLPELNYAMVPQPVVKEPYTAMGVRLVGFTSGSKHKQQAYLLARYVSTNPEAQRLLAPRKLSWVRAVANDPLLLDTPPNRNKRAMLASVQWAELIYPLTEHWTEVQRFYDQNMPPVLRNQIPVQSAAEEIDRRVNAILGGRK